ncbi:MAG: lysophospholipid acyltransferase family protein, partial [Chloroflexota bacterium]
MSNKPRKTNLIQRIVRLAILRLVHLFYPKIKVSGREKLPQGKPIIFVLNHPNGLLDPLVLMLGLNREVSFLAASTLFGNIVGRTLCESFGALPVYRHRDEGKAGGPQGDMKERNETTFARCRALLRAGKHMALFPEGTTHGDPELLPFRTGAARIALSAEAEAAWQMGLQIVPVGLWYQQKTIFRSSILLVVGEPLEVNYYAEAYDEDTYQAARQLTEVIETGLNQVVSQAENADLLAAVPVLAAWTAPSGEGVTLAQQHQWTVRLLKAYHYLQDNDPLRLETIAETARSYANTLQTLGISNPWALELPSVKRRR